MVKNRKEFVVIVIVVSFLVMILGAWPLSVPVISDETTTMANAAWLVGYDWDLMVAALGGYYYRFGQALLTVPFFAFLKDPAMIYRLSMVLQAMIQVSIVPVVYVICRRHLRVKSEVLAALLGAAVCFVPSMALYVYYYRGDFLLGVLPWYVLLAFLETVRADEEGKSGRRIFWTVLAVFFAVFSYSAHTRGIVVLIALLMAAALVRVFLKRKSLHWPVLLAGAAVFLFVDSRTGRMFQSALYSLSGLNANALESTDVGQYFSIFSFSALKDLFMLCLSWLQTLIASTQGLVWLGIVVFFVVLAKVLWFRKNDVTDAEKTVVLFSGLIFAGYYAAGALFFRGAYLALRTGALERRVDRLLYDRYAICGAGMIIFVALYALCVRTEWLKWKSRLICVAGAGVIFFIWLKKILPTAIKYTGYIYNTIILNTFQKIENPANILSGQKYSRRGLLLISIFGICMLVGILLVSMVRKKWMPYVLLGVVLLSDLALIEVNFVKVRKASNDYVVEATEEVVDFMETFEDEITDEFPYILKGGLSGIKIQFYQSQLMSYRMFGKNQEEALGLTDYFIISKHGDVDLTWYEDDYYTFADFDYENATYDIVYVKGERLKEKLEQLGYKMEKYIPENRMEEDKK